MVMPTYGLNEQIFHILSLNKVKKKKIQNMFLVIKFMKSIVMSGIQHIGKNLDICKSAIVNGRFLSTDLACMFCLTFWFVSDSAV